MKKEPIRKTLIALRKGASVTFPIERYDSVVSSVSRLNVVVAGRRWKTAIIRDNPDESNPIYVKVTRVE